MRKHVPLLLAIVATAVEGASVTLAFTAENASRLLQALLLHAVAAGLSLCAGRKRRRGKVSPVENDAMLFSALFIPGFGPPIAWTLPHKEEESREVENAHEVFERYEEHVRPQVPDYERSLFTGDFDRDLARELDAESYYEVLRNGSIDQKRNALRSLADMGQPKHLELVRRCLEDSEQEVRLYAYSEIERLGRAFEEGIEEKTKTVEKDPTNFEALCDLAESYYRYGLSGILDQGLSAYHFRIALQYAKAAAACGDGRVECHLIQALSLSALGDNHAARETLELLPPEKHGDPRIRMIRARIAYVERDFAAMRVEGDALAEAGEELPPWLEAVRTGSAEPPASVEDPHQFPAPAPAGAPDREEMREPEWDEEPMHTEDENEAAAISEMSPARGESLPKARSQERAVAPEPDEEIGDRTSEAALDWNAPLDDEEDADADRTADEGFLATRDLEARPAVDPDHTTIEQLSAAADEDQTSDDEQLRTAALAVEPGVAGKPSDLPDADDLEQTLDELEERLLKDAARELGAIDPERKAESDAPFEDDGGTLGETADDKATPDDLTLTEGALEFDPKEEEG